MYNTGSPNYYCLGVRFNGYTCHSGCTGASVDIPSQWSGCDNTFFKFYNGTSLCNNRASSILYSTGVGGGPATQVQIKGGTLGSGTAPFDVTTLYFKDIPFTWYEYTRTQGNPHTCHYGVHQTCTYNDATYTTATNKGHVDGVIYITAGSHVHVSGNVSADGASTNSKATLDLPSGGAQYSLMIDGNLQEDKINTQKNGVITNLATMAPYAVIGVNGNYVPGGTMGTNANGGGTILVGAGTSDQSKMTIRDVTGNDNPGGGFGFSGSGQTVYTGTCVPTNGTANFGNYGNNAVTLGTPNGPTLPSALTKGGLQIFNTMNALTMDKTYTIAQGGTGHLLMMAHTKLTIKQTQTLSSSTAAKTNLMGGDVEFASAANEAFTGSGTGEYSVVAFGGTHETPTRTNPNAIGAVGLCTPSHPWCKRS